MVRKSSSNTALPALDQQRETSSGIAVRQVYEGAHLAPGLSSRLGAPGGYPFTRGIHETMYRGRLWTMRQYAGYGNAAEANQRFRYLLQQGTTGLSVAFDLPTQMGYDPDHALAHGEVGRVGVSIATLDDMEDLFRDIPLDQVSVSMTINSTAAILLCMLLIVAERRSVPWTALQGTVQNDILKEYIARGTYIYPPAAGLRLATDIVEFGTQHVPHWNTLSISGYHIREAGSTAVQELAFTFADAIAYVEQALTRGLQVDSFAPRLAFFFNSHSNFFEEIAKFRAARRLWARIMRERFGAKDNRSLMLRFHTQTAGSTLTAQQPLNNVVRTTLEGLAAVLGGTQSLHTNSYDEALSLPTEGSALLALRTQQIIAFESGVCDTVDPLGGSYFIENLTDELEARTERMIAAIDAMGGMVRAIEEGFPQREIEQSAYRAQKDVECGARRVVGVNCYRDEESRQSTELPNNDRERAEAEACKRVRSLRAKRNVSEFEDSQTALAGAAARGSNLLPLILESLRKGATLGSISDTLRKVFGEYDFQNG